MKYKVKYKRWLFWRTLEVVGDGYVEDRNVRFFILEDNTRVEIPANNIIFIFSPTREKAISESRNNVVEGKL